MHFSRIVLKSAFVASALAAPISVEVNAGDVLKPVTGLAQPITGLAQPITGAVTRNIPVVGEAVSNLLPVITETTDALPVGNIIRDVTSAVAEALAKLGNVAGSGVGIAGPAQTDMVTRDDDDDDDDDDDADDADDELDLDIDEVDPSVIASTLTTTTGALNLTALLDMVKGDADPSATISTLTTSGGALNATALFDMVKSEVDDPAEVLAMMKLLDILKSMPVARDVVSTGDGTLPVAPEVGNGIEPITGALPDLPSFPTVPVVEEGVSVATGALKNITAAHDIVDEDLVSTGTLPIVPGVEVPDLSLVPTVPVVGEGVSTGIAAL